MVASYDVAGAQADDGLDDLVTFAAALCETPYALVTLIEGEYQHFLARTGTDLPGTQTEISFCAHAVGSPGVTEILDTTGDPRFAANPLVTGDLHLRFYAGVPMISPEGVALGTVCVLDDRERGPLTLVQRQGLAVLARAAMERLDHRRTLTAGQETEASTRQALEESELRFRTLADTMPQMVWSTRSDGFHDYFNARWYEFTGTPEGTTDGEGWNDMFHPDDQERAWDQWRHCLETGEPYAIEYRLKHFTGTYRWVLGRALAVRDEAGAITRWFGTCTDIHEQKLAMEEREIISQELSHRIKNIFAVIAGLIQFAARSRPGFAPIAADLRERITALGRAHDFVRPHSAQSRPSAQQDSLHGLLADLFAPYAGVDSPRVRIEGDDLLIDDRSATPLALLFHELATNATKYGALSNAQGGAVVAIAVDDGSVRLRWGEHGGPAVVAPDGPAGFGTQLIELSAVRQLGGTVERHWRPEGLIVEIAVPRAAFSRR